MPAKPTHCDRLLAILSDGKPHDHHALYRQGMIVHSRVADLRKKGHVIRSWHEGDSYFYQLEPQKHLWDEEA